MDVFPLGCCGVRWIAFHIDSAHVLMFFLLIPDSFYELYFSQYFSLSSCLFCLFSCFIGYLKFYLVKSIFLLKFFILYLCSVIPFEDLIRSLFYFLVDLRFILNSLNGLIYFSLWYKVMVESGFFPAKERNRLLRTIPFLSIYHLIYTLTNI